jgi:4-carboxymuconolactone decarboxylase
VARVRLIDPSDVPEEHRAFVEALADRHALINLYRAMAHSPVMLRRLIDLLSGLWDGSLSGRDREIAILSVVTAANAPYPLGWHIGDAVEAGVTTDEVQAIVSGNADAGLAPRDAAVARFARELTTDVNVSDATFDAVAHFMDEQQLVELSVLAGLYRLVAGVANGLRVELDDEPARALERIRGSSELG